MTLNRVMGLTLRYFIVFGKPAFQHWFWSLNCLWWRQLPVVDGWSRRQLWPAVPARRTSPASFRVDCHQAYVNWRQSPWRCVCQPSDSPTSADGRPIHARRPGDVAALSQTSSATSVSNISLPQLKTNTSSGFWPTSNNPSTSRWCVCVCRTTVRLHY